MKCMTRYDEYRTIKTQESIRQQLMSELELESPATDQEIIDTASLRHAARLLLDHAEPGPHLATRNLLEQHIEDTNKVAGEDLEWFRWHKGIPTDQDIVMLACGAEHQAPSGKSGLKRN